MSNETYLMKDCHKSRADLARELEDLRPRLAAAERDREAFQRQLQSADEELKRFTYTASHDLRSPLVTIQGYIGLLEEDLAAENPSAVADDMRRISGAAGKMQRLLDSLLKLSRIERIVNPPTSESLADLVDEVIEQLATRLQQRGVEVQISPDLPMLFGDRVRLLEVVRNLVDNGIKFMGDQSEPRIEIGARSERGETVCYVRDNGIGIDPAFHERIFGLFKQLNPKADGSGVGLTLTKRIVELHGGRVWVESEGEGQGTTFCFCLPEREEAENRAL